MLLRQLSPVFNVFRRIRKFVHMQRHLFLVATYTLRDLRCGAPYVVAQCTCVLPTLSSYFICHISRCSCCRLSRHLSRFGGLVRVVTLIKYLRYAYPGRTERSTDRHLLDDVCIPIVAADRVDSDLERGARERTDTGADAHRAFTVRIDLDR